MFKDIEIFADRNCIVGEGPTYDEINKQLYTVDIRNNCYFVTDYNSGKVQKYDVPQQLGCLALCEDGDVILSMEDGIYFRDAEGKLTLAHKPTEIKGRRFNDGKVGPDGCYYVGTTDNNKKGAFYRLSNGILTEIFGDCGCSNGLDWTKDAKTLYYCDSREQKIESFDFSITQHSLSNRKTIMNIAEDFGSGDGMTIDEKGNLWLAVWGGYCVLNIEPSTGRVLKEIKLPVEKVSSCAFAGDDMKDLIITSAAFETSLDEQPYAGYTFRYRCDVPGCHINRYKK